jgi:replicative DNA helicase
VSGALKHLGKILNIPILAVCQLSRAVETRGGSKRPQLSDLRGSGKLEQDATVVIAPYRAEYYGIIEDENGNSLVGKGEIIFLKNQNDGLFQPKIVGFDGIKGWYDIEQDPFEYHEQGKTLPHIINIPAGARPDLNDEPPW